MNAFLAAANNITATTNGATALKSTGAFLLDAFFKLPTYRSGNSSYANAVAMFDRALNENPEYAIRLAFYLRNIRGVGSGERELFRQIMKHLLTKNPKIVLANLRNIIQYGRWDDLVYLATVDNSRTIYNFLKEQFNKDLDFFYGEETNFAAISLLAKWLPSVEYKPRKKLTEKKQMHKKFIEEFCEQLNCHESVYRKKLSILRKAIKLVEHNITNGKIHEIKYETVPSCAHKLYSKMFYKYDLSRYKEYIAKVNKGEAKINSSVLTPGEIVKKYYNLEKDIANALWKNLPSFEGTESLLPVIDTSASMISNNVREDAFGLGIFISERNPGDFKHIYSMFSATVNISNFEPTSKLSDKLAKLYTHNASNTNLKGLFEHILKTYKINNLKPEQLPDGLIILSDMQFDEGVSSSQTLYQEIKSLYDAEGVKLPKIVWWNLAADENVIQNNKDEKGVIMVGGKSFQTLKAVMTGQDITPYTNMIKVLDSLEDIVTKVD